MAILDLYEETFDQVVVQSEKPFLVYFSAKWCGPCHAMKPIVEEISEELSEQLSIGKLDVDYAPSIAAGYGIRSIPAFVLFKNGEAASQFSGSCGKDRLKALLEERL